MDWFSENDLNNFFGEVIRNVAKELKVKEWEWLFYSELLEEIRTQNSSVHRKLNEFFGKYRSWHNFHVEIDREGKAGNLSPSEQSKLQNLASARDSARDSLLKELRN